MAILFWIFLQEIATHSPFVTSSVLHINLCWCLSYNILLTISWLKLTLLNWLHHFLFSKTFCIFSDIQETQFVCSWYKNICSPFHLNYMTCWNKACLSTTCSDAIVGDWYHLSILHCHFHLFLSQPMRKYSFGLVMNSYLVKMPRYWNVYFCHFSCYI